MLGMSESRIEVIFATALLKTPRLVRCLPRTDLRGPPVDIAPKSRLARVPECTRSTKRNICCLETSWRSDPPGIFGALVRSSDICTSSPDYLLPSSQLSVPFLTNTPGRPPPPSIHGGPVNTLSRLAHGHPERGRTTQTPEYTL